MADYIVFYTDGDEPELATKQVFQDQARAESWADRLRGAGRPYKIEPVRATILQDGVIGKYFGYETQAGTCVWV